MAANQLGDGSADGVYVPSGGKVAFYGSTPVAQRASTSVQRTSNLSTATGTISVSTAAFNQVVVALSEVMNTLQAYGLWSIS